MGSPCHFALFELQPAFRLDQAQLSARYRELAKAVHPDRFDDAAPAIKAASHDVMSALHRARRELP